MKQAHVFAIALLGATLVGAAADSSHSKPSGPPFPLSDASPSPEALIGRLLVALQRNDEKAMHALRVNEREYRELIAPGTVPPGNPPRETRADVSEFYWRMLDSKSRDLGRELLRTYGGKTMTVEKIEYTRPPLEYAWYRASGQVRVHVHNEAGKEAIVPAGWVAEVDGQYKFIGLNWDD